MDCIASIGQQLSAGSLHFRVLLAWRQKQFRPPSSCFIFCLITLIIVSVAENRAGWKVSQKTVWEALMFLELWLKTFRFGLH